MDQCFKLIPRWLDPQVSAHADLARRRGSAWFVYLGLFARRAQLATGNASDLGFLVQSWLPRVADRADTSDVRGEGSAMINVGTAHKHVHSIGGVISWRASGNRDNHHARDHRTDARRNVVSGRPAPTQPRSSSAVPLHQPGDNPGGRHRVCGRRQDDQPNPSCYGSPAGPTGPRAGCDISRHAARAAPAARERADRQMNKFH